MVGDVARKQLWGRSGSRCAICNVELTRLDGHDVIVGDEAHIRSKRVGGPRHEPMHTEPLDSYANLILLCKAHHKLVDDNAEVFPAEDLVQLKHRHETRVARLLGRVDRSPWVVEPDLHWIVNGTDFAEVVIGAQAYMTSHVHPRDDQAGLIASVLENGIEWGEIADDLGPRGAMDAAMSLQADLESLLEHGLMLIGGTGQLRHNSGFVLTTAVLHIERIVDLEPER